MPSIAPSTAPSTPPSTPISEPIAEAFARLGVPQVATPAQDPGTPGVWIPEVTSDADLRAIARRADPSSPDHLQRWLWCGSAGLAQALAALPGFAAAGNDSSGLSADTSGDDGGDAGNRMAAASGAAAASAAARRVLMLGASHHAVVRRQWAWLAAQRPTAVRMREGDAEALAAAGAALGAGWDVAALELSPLRPMSADEAAGLLRAQLGELVERIARPATLLVIGGDSLLALCRATGVSSLRTAPPLRAGWGSALLVGGRWDGVRCHSRSGAFGDDDDLARMLDQVAPARAEATGGAGAADSRGRRRGAAG